MKIVIISNKEGYRRAGLGFRKGENVFDSEKLTAEQLKAIEADPNLTVKYDVDGDEESATLAETLALVTAERDDALGEVAAERNKALAEIDELKAKLEKALAERDEAVATVKEMTKGMEVGVNQIDQLKEKLAKAEAENEKLKKAAKKEAK